MERFEKVRKWIIVLAVGLAVYQLLLSGISLYALSWNTPSKRGQLVEFYKYDLVRLHLRNDQVALAVIWGSLQSIMYFVLYALFIYKFKKNLNGARKFGLILTGVNSVLVALSLRDGLVVTILIELGAILTMFVLLWNIKLQVEKNNNVKV